VTLTCAADMPVQVLTEFDPPDEAVPQQVAWCGSDALVVKYEVWGSFPCHRTHERCTPAQRAPNESYVYSLT